MEAEILSTNHQFSVLHHSLPAIIPVLLVSIGYVDPGKWVATVEGGARFGFDLVAFMLAFNLAAILCQYLSARIGVITGRDLAEICRDEYDTWTCMFLGVQTELSAITLDLNMILGMAHGLNLLFGWDLFTCVFLTAANAILLPLLLMLMENWKAKLLCLWVAGFLFLSFVFGVLISQPEIPLFTNAMLTKLSGESAFVLMSLLGANIMPHNFYLHSATVQCYQGPRNISKDTICHNHFWAILCAFSGIYLVNNALMSAAANLFHSTGVLLITFQDALSLMEQVFRSPVAPFAFFMVPFLSNQITAMSWTLGGQGVLNGFLKLEIPGWLHYATIRIFAMIPAIYCVWSAGAEGMYQLLIYTQVFVALLLPSSVIPLFRVAGSRSIMGLHKMSQLVEFFELIIFIGMLVLNVIFVVEMVLGTSDWVGNLGWDAGNGIALPYLVLLVTACASFCLMLWLAATPLKSASVALDAQVWNWDVPKEVQDTPINREECTLTETRYPEEESGQKQEPSAGSGKSFEYGSDVSVANFHRDLPETAIEPCQELHLTTVESKMKFHNSPSRHTEELASTIESEPVSIIVNEVSDAAELPGTKTVKVETTAPVEKTHKDQRDMHNEKDDDGDIWETEEPPEVVSASSPSVTTEGPPSFQNLSGKSDEGGNGVGSLSRLAGLGRAARRQLAAILDEFWGQLYDFHGQMTQEAQSRKLDMLLGVDFKIASSLRKADLSGKEYPDYLPSIGGRGSDTLLNASVYDPTKQQRVQSNVESPYGSQRGSSFSLYHAQLSDALVQNSNRNVLHSGERRYSSVRNLPSSEVWDYQPATVHGYQLSSYINQVGKDRNSDNLNGQMDSSSLKPSPLGYPRVRDSVAFALGQQLQNGLSTGHPPGFQNVPASRNSSLLSDISYHDFGPSVPAENASSVNTKKYCSLPDISGYSVFHRNNYVSDKNSLWHNSLGYASSAGRVNCEPSLLGSGLRVGGSLALDAHASQLSPNLDAGSLWSRQPFEQFGVADMIQNIGKEGVGSRQNSIAQEPILIVDSEAKLLQSFRHSIVKLLKLEGSDWLFRQNDGADEELIDRVAAREKFLYDAEAREMNWVSHMGGTQYPSCDRKSGSATKRNEVNVPNSLVSSVPNCGEDCIWRLDLIVSFGVWCIHRILDLSLMESRPELWGKYTYVLNRLQGIIDPAFLKSRSPMTPCFCLEVPVTQHQKSSPPVNEMLPPAAKPAKGKCTTASILLDLVKDVEIAITGRKGRSGTAAGDVAFPKGKENLASVLKRYKRRLSNKQASTHEGAGLRKVLTSAPYNSTS